MTSRKARLATTLAVLAALSAGAFGCLVTIDRSRLDAIDGVVDASDAEASSADAPSIDAFVPQDAGDVCAPRTVIDSVFSVDLAGWEPLGRASGAYPRIETFAGMPAAVLFPFQPASELQFARSGVWLAQPVALEAFDLSAQVQLRCTSTTSCADGVALAWLDTTDRTRLTSSNVQQTMGLPDGTTGSAVVFDIYRNAPPETPDPLAPSLQLVVLDPKAKVGAYDWFVDTAPASFLQAWHTVTIRVRGDQAVVGYDGAELLSGKVPRVALGLFGITAGTGGETHASAVRNVRGTFYDCIP
jgi:hypothetical protein